MDQGCGGSGLAGAVVQVCFPTVRTAVLDSLNRQREEGRLCDLSIHVQGQVFRAHRCVMAASSPYFHDQVLLKNVTTVSLPSVMDPLVFESVLSSAYTGQLSIVRDDIVNYVTVASFLQMWHIVDKCTEILKKPRPPGGAQSHGGPSRQQSPSSTDCLYTERERERQRGQDTKEREPRERGPAGPATPEKRLHGSEQGPLPPLATWRHPQQFSRWSRPRAAAQALPPHSSADSQLDPNPGAESDYSSCEEVWMSSSKASPRGPDGGGAYRVGFDHAASRVSPHNAGGYMSDARRLRARVRQKGAVQQNASVEDFQKFGARGSERQSMEGGQAFGDTEGELQIKKSGERGTEPDEGMGEVVEEEDDVEGLERTAQSAEYPTSVYQGEEGEAADKPEEPETAPKDGKMEFEKDSDISSLRGVEPEGAGPGPACPGSALPGRMQWQASPWLQQGSRPLEGEEDYRREEEEDEEEEEEVDFGRFADEGGVAFGPDTYDEIEDGTGQVSQRPLVPASPSDDSEYHLGPPDLSWPSVNIAPQGQGGAGAPGSGRHVPPSSAAFPPSSSPPIPSSSSSLSLSGPAYSGKVHFCHCGKAYTLKSMRDRHVKMQHLNLRPFACPVCAKTFKMKHHLTKHLKTHGGLRPYECGLCGKKVIWRDSFLRHQARCERLAAAGMPPSYEGAGGGSGGMSAADMDDSYGYGFDETEGFLSEGGQVKVEEAEFQGEAESAIGGLLGGVSGEASDMGGHARTLMSGQELKEEEGDRYS